MTETALTDAAVDEIRERYRRRADVFEATVAAIGSDDWGRPSPCAEWDARDVVRTLHADGTVINAHVRQIMTSEVQTARPDQTSAAWGPAPLRRALHAELAEPVDRHPAGGVGEQPTTTGDQLAQPLVAQPRRRRRLLLGRSLIELRH